MPHRRPPLLQALSQALRATPELDRRVVVVGVGSTLRSDDAAGLRIAEALRTLALPNVLVLFGDTAPENVTGEVRRARPSHVLFVDAADLGESPGSVRLLDAAEIGGMSSSTHTLPLGVIADYLTRDLGCRVLFLGLQPKSVAFGEGLSREVSSAVAETTEALACALGA
ncbi:MAG: hydrogenase maturation peptidase HycI [Thermotogota bacterium]